MLDNTGDHVTGQPADEHLDPPQMQVGKFGLWVHGCQFPDAQDAWNGNWLNLTARCIGDSGANSVFGPILDTVSLFKFRSSLMRWARAFRGRRSWSPSNRTCR